MALIEFEDGVTKGNAETFNHNFNEVKHQDITTDGDPVKCGYKTDGKDTYVKLVDCGYLNGGTQKIPHGISNIYNMYGYKGFFRNESNKTVFPIPRYSTSNVGVDADIDTTNINITSGTAFNGTGFKAYIYIYFTYNE